MKLYLLLLRGINVGGNNKVPMKALKKHLEEAGFDGVSTYIQSGNVVLSAHSDPSVKVAEIIHCEFGFRPSVISFEKNSFDKMVSENPYADFDEKTVHFYFCERAPKPDYSKIDSYLSNDETYQLNNTVFYLHAPNGIGRSKLVLNIESCLGVSYTGRNLNTVLKLQGMMKSR